MTKTFGIALQIVTAGVLIGFVAMNALDLKNVLGFRIPKYGYESYEGLGGHFALSPAGQGIIVAITILWIVYGAIALGAFLNGRGAKSTSIGVSGSST